MCANVKQKNGSNHSEDVTIGKVLPVRQIQQALLHADAHDLALLVLRLEPSELVELGQTDPSLFRLFPQRVSAFVLLNKVVAQCKCEDDDTEVRHKRNAPRHKVARTVLHLPELRAQNLAQGVTDKEDGVGSHFLGVTRDGRSDP